MTGGTFEPYPQSRTSAAADADLAQAVVASASDAILVLDLRGRVVLWNDGCEALFGWTAEEVLGRSAEVLVPTHRREELVRVVRGLEGRREPAALETERVHKLGELRPVSCRVSPVRDAHGALVGVSAVVRDNSREVELRRQLEQARHVAEARFEQSVVAQATLSPDGVLLDVNPALCELSGHPRHRLLGTRVTDHMAAFDLEAVTLGLARLARGETPGGRHPHMLRHADGHLVETRVSIFPVRGDLSDEVLRLEAVVEDVSLAAAAERELKVRETRWESLAAHSVDVGLFCDADGKVLFVTPAVESVFGYGRTDGWDLDGFAFVHPADREHVRARWRTVVAAPPGTTETLELRLRHADGSWRWVEQSLTNQLADPAVQAVVVNLVDVSTRRAAETVLEELAGVDTLTGLATRAPLMASLDAALSASLGPSTAVLVVDVAELSLVNDQHGHLVGDELLVRLGDRLTATAAGRGLVARLGGDRFAVLQPDVDGVTDVFEEALRHLAALQQPLEVGGTLLHPGAAVGAALGPALSSGALLASAEAALAAAKQGLTGPVHVVRAETESVALARARLLSDLRRGIAAHEMVVHFQPVVSLATGRPRGAEALVRWQHPDKGLLSPGTFMEVLEESSLVLDLGREVLGQACRAAARWRSLDGVRPTVAVNLSARQLTHPGLLESVQTALGESGLPADQLVLEVTESALMSDVDTAVRTLHELRGLGVSLAIDDFGTGYSSLTYLKRFPATALKIDRSFVSGLGRSDDDAVIVSSVVDLARAMGLECVAEGVETEQQRLVLQALGCPTGQGHLWAPALALPAFEAWLGRTGGTGPPPAATTPASGATAGAGVTGAERAAQLARAGASLHTIAAALNGDGLTTPRGKRWTPRSVAELLGSDGVR